MSDDSIQKTQVLIADDDVSTRFLLRTAISQWGYQVIEAKDGNEAWEILQKEDAPRLLILDWLMPGMDGITLCEKIKKQIINNHPYIILLTQVSGPENITKGLDAGADEFLIKPFNMVELRSRLAVGKKLVIYGNEILKKTNALHAFQQKVNALVATISDISQPQSNENSQILQEKLAKIGVIINKFISDEKEGE